MKSVKHLLFFVLFLLCSVNTFAQDVIVKKDGSTVVCRVIKLTETEIVYKQWSDLNGSNYIMDRSLAATINYQDGKKVDLSDMTNLYKPGNQHDGVQQYNDRALMAIDKESHQIPKKAKQLKTIGLVGGIGFTIIGGLCLWKDGGDTETAYFIPGLVSLGCGVGCTTYCLIKAHSIKKQAKMYQSSIIYQHDFQFNNGSNLSAGVDMISDRSMGTKTLGIGLRYNF